MSLWNMNVLHFFWSSWKASLTDEIMRIATTILLFLFIIITIIIINLAMLRKSYIHILTLLLLAKISMILYVIHDIKMLWTYT